MFPDYNANNLRADETPSDQTDSQAVKLGRAAQCVDRKVAVVADSTLPEAPRLHSAGVCFPGSDMEFQV